MTVKYKLAESVVCISDIVRIEFGTVNSRYQRSLISRSMGFHPYRPGLISCSSIWSIPYHQRNSNYDRRIRSRFVPLNSTTALVRNSIALSDSGPVIGMVVEDMADDSM